MSQAKINDSIPVEIMGEIFIRCHPPDPLKHQQPNVMIAPMVLCHVCSHWREIALKNPGLWTHLYHVGYLNNLDTFETRDFAFLEWWRRNVKDMPLSLRLAFKYDFREGSPKNYQWVERCDYLKSLALLLSNIRYLNLDHDYQILFRRLQGLPGPKVDTIVFHGDRLGGIDQRYCRHNLLLATLKHHLRRVFMEDTCMSIEDVSSILDFSILTHLHLSMTIMLDIWFSILQQSKKLMYASFLLTILDRDDIPSPTGIVLPHLRQLAVEINGHPVFYRSFLEGVSLPALVALRIPHPNPLNIERLHGILSSTPNLQRLQLGERHTWNHGRPPFVFVNGDLSPTAHRPLSDVVPHLSSIHFQYGYTVTNVFLPKYRNLAISVLEGDWLQLGRPGSRLSQIWVGGDHKTIMVGMNMFVDELQAYIPEGVKFSVRPSELPNLSTSWEQRYRNFTYGFEDLRLDEI